MARLGTLLALILCLGASRAAASPLILVTDVGGPLYTVDAGTGNVTMLGNTGVIMADIAFAPSGDLYGISEDKLYRIDLTSSLTISTPQLVGSMGISPWSLVFGADGTLYAATDGLYSLSTSTGLASLIGSGGYAYGSGSFPGFTGDLAFVGGQLYLTSPSLDFDAGFAYEDLVRIDTATGAGSLVGRLGTRDINSGDVTGFLTVWGLASPNGVDLYGVLGRQVIGIDVATATGTLLEEDYGVPQFPSLGGANGAASGTEAVGAPEPGATLLLAGALFCLAALRPMRRRTPRG